MARLSFALVVVVVAIAGAVVPAQQIFKSAVSTVSVYATVSDKSGRLIPNLTKDDFEVFDNKKPEPISVFYNDPQFIKVVVMLDESGSMVNNIEMVKDGAEQFLMRLLPQDQARIGSFEDKIILSPSFTNDRDSLIRFLREDLQYGNGTLLWEAINRGMDALAPLDGRRVVLVFTDGYDETSPHASFDSVLKRAQAQSFMVYAIGFHSRYRGGPNGSMVESAPDGGLRKLAAETGGGYFELRQAQAADLGSTFTRVIEELHSQYMIGFTPEALDGKVHALDVRVKQTGMTARARTSYVASQDIK